MRKLTTTQKGLLAMAGLAIGVGSILEFKMPMDGWVSSTIRFVQILSALVIATLARKML
jgi:hypothetical protein